MPDPTKERALWKKLTRLANRAELAEVRTAIYGYAVAEEERAAATLVEADLKLDAAETGFDLAKQSNLRYAEQSGAGAGKIHYEVFSASQAEKVGGEFERAFAARKQALKDGYRVHDRLLAPLCGGGTVDLASPLVTNGRIVQHCLKPQMSTQQSERQTKMQECLKQLREAEGQPLDGETLDLILRNKQRASAPAMQRRITIE